MNLIDFHVTKVLGPPVQAATTQGRPYWLTTVEYWDDGGIGQVKQIASFSQEHADSIKVGYIGQH